MDPTTYRDMTLRRPDKSFTATFVNHKKKVKIRKIKAVNLDAARDMAKHLGQVWAENLLDVTEDK